MCICDIEFCLLMRKRWRWLYSAFTSIYPQETTISQLSSMFHSSTAMVKACLEMKLKILMISRTTASVTKPSYLRRPSDLNTYRISFSQKNTGPNKRNSLRYMCMLVNQHQAISMFIWFNRCHQWLIQWFKTHVYSVLKV